MESRNIKFILKMNYLVGNNPQHRGTVVQKMLFCLSLGTIGTTACLASSVFFCEKNLHMIDITEAAQALSFCAHSILKLIWFRKQYDKELDLLLETNKFWDVNDLEDQEEKLQMLKYLRYLRVFVTWYLIFALIPSSVVILRPILFGILPFRSYVPEGSYPFIVITEQYSIICMVLSVVGSDAFFGSLIVLTTIQWRMLNNDIKRNLAVIIENDTDRLLIKNKMRRCINHHVFLLGFVEKINNTLSYGLLLYIGVLVYASCVELFAMTTGQPINEFFKSITFTFAMIYQFVVFYIFPGQLLTTEAARTEKMAFDSNWYTNYKFSSSTITMISSVSRKPVNVHAYGIVNLCYSGGLQVYKAILSYYMFLRTINIGAPK